MTSEKLIFCMKTIYSNIHVYEKGFVRIMSLGDAPRDNTQAMIDVRDLGKHMLEYTRMVFAGLLLNEDPKNVLVIGLGSGVIIREIHQYFPKADIDIVEIDSEVVKVAEKFFFFKPDEKIHVHVEDGREYIHRQAAMHKVYDTIILDAFDGDYIPTHLTTQEFLAEVRRLLDPKGVVIANILSSHRFFDSQVQTFKEEFGRCYLFFDRHVSNVILTAPGSALPDLKRKEGIERAKLLQERYGFSFSMSMVAKQFKPGYRPDHRAQVLTDHSGYRIRIIK